MIRIGMAGLAAGAFLVGLVVFAGGGDPVVLLAMGPRAWGYDLAVELVGRDVATWQGWGHDGQFFFVQATNPLWIGDTEAARLLNLELYRGQRMLFPLLVGLGGLTPGPALPWMFGAVHVLAFGIGCAASARLAEQAGAHPRWGLLFAANPAMLLAVQVGGAGVLALALALAGTADVNDGRTRRAAALFALSVLSREVMLLYCAGVVLFEWRRSGKLPLALGAAPLAAFALWYGYLLTRLEYEAVFESNGSIGAPFRGIATASGQWGLAELGAAVLVMLVSILVLRRLIMRGSALLAGSAGFAVLAVLLGAPVWLNYFDITRTLSPLFIAFLLSTFAVPNTEAQTVPDRSRPSNEAHEGSFGPSSVGDLVP